MSQTFQKTKEDFICEHCGAEVIGTGYTNHCPRCLWGKHVDVHPGDRAETCGGMMEPVRVEIKGRQERIVHRCQTCGAERIVDAAPDDNHEALAMIAAQQSL